MAIIEQHNLTVLRKKGELPSLPFSEMAKTILGTSYTLTVVFCTPTESQERNRTYRNKDYPTNILSFPLEKNEGEIYICLSVVRKEAKKFAMTYQEFLTLLLVHGMLHLKGYDHGSTMEKLEKKYHQQFFRGK